MDTSNDIPAIETYPKDFLASLNVTKSTHPHRDPTKRSNWPAEITSTTPLEDLFQKRIVTILRGTRGPKPKPIPDPLGFLNATDSDLDRIANMGAKIREVIEKNLRNVWGTKPPQA